MMDSVDGMAVIGILRGVEPSFFPDLMAASYAGGLRALEVTMNTRGAEDMVADNLAMVPDGCRLGMGTIRNIIEARAAVEAGAMFLVSPNMDPEVIDFGRSREVPVIAGAMTPTEVYQAWSAGASMVKVFPCPGPGYIKDLLGPFDHIPLVAVGGVNDGNVKEFFVAGAQAVGVGSSLFGHDALITRDPEQVEKNVKIFVDLCQQVKNGL